MKTQNKQTKVPTIVIKTEKPIGGYWDGGTKSLFEFEPELHEDKKGLYVKWGSYAANYWFTCGFGKSWQHAATIGKKTLECKFNPRVPYTIEIIWHENE